MGMRVAAEELRAQLAHPVIDVEAHHLEYLPAVEECLREGMGHHLFERWRVRQTSGILPLSDRVNWRQPQAGWWTALPATKPEDRAAAALPSLLKERMDSYGIDFMVLHTSIGLGTLSEPDEEIRRAFCSSLNEFYADQYLAFGDRLTPAGIVPMFTPEEALSELEHCRRIGLRAVQLPHGVPRPVPNVHEARPDLFPAVHWLDTFGLDSALNYDPVWQYLTDAGFAATFHGHSQYAAAVKSSRSVTNYVYNHIGAHAGLMFDLCKSLLMGGVPRRFPNLQFAFFEGGVHWAAALLNDFVNHWEKRNTSTVNDYDPRRLDTVEMQRLFRVWGGRLIAAVPDSDLTRVYANLREGPTGDIAEPDNRDDFAACGIEGPMDIVRQFESFFFGCGADDPTLSFAFNPANALGIQLRAMFGTDFGHWDTGVLERGLLSPEYFQAFVADNAIRLHGRMNPQFWKGTVVERYATQVLQTSKSGSTHSERAKTPD